ncbi:MAG: sodium:proton exchanger, partial [Gammaproteobacteria bacterium]|nr:sodium:proton exchanger [Gammaproteobacteria bacterium]
MRIIALAILFVVMTLVGMFQLGGTMDDPMARTMVGFGFLIFTGLVAGELARLISLPRITGYLIAGMICGPYVLDLIDPDVIENLKTVDDLALALIAFTAGGELHLERV